MTDDLSDIEHNPARPSVNLPKGGGAINGIGEKFNANAVSGTGSFSVPIALTAGRSGFNPDLALSYDSGSGNSVFGMGFSLSLPAITRKTANGLPLYNDELFDRNIIKNIQPVSDEAKISPDVFLLSGAEDLVPELDPNGARVFRDLNGVIIPHHALANAPIIVIRFRPRIEGLFARIEKVIDNGNTYWRSISKENILTIYGNSSDAKICDPLDSKKIYKWLIERTVDAKGNIITYEYKRENSDNISSLSSFERQRLIDGHSYSNCYIKRVNYGNSVPYNRTNDNFNQSAEPNKYHFTLLFDYGEHDIAKPALT